MISTFSSNTDAKEENISHLLYYLCKENEIEKVQNILLSIDNKNIINRIQTSTGSTCLHVACYYGHRDMVQILLDYGALRSTRNLRHNLTPYEEIHADDIKQLFVKQQELFSNNSYDYIEWSLVDDDLLGKRRRFRQVINLYKTYDNHTLISKLIAEFIHYYLNEYLLNLSNSTGNPEDRVTPEQIKTLEAYFKGAIEEKDYLTYFIKAYTLTNGFHKILNKHLALYILDYFDESKIFLPTYRLVNCLAHIVTLIIYHPNLSQYEYRGVCYRGMRVTQYDLNQYKVNQHMLNRSFLSTSSDRHVAAMFAGEGQQSKMRYTPKGDWALQYSCLCQYSIKQNATAIDINTLSTKPEEKEVLILPFTVFKVIDIKRNDLYNPTAPISIEIELEECEDPNDDFKQLKNMKETKQSRCFNINRLLPSVLFLTLSLIVLFIIHYIRTFTVKPNGLTTTPLGQYNSTVNPILSTGHFNTLINTKSKQNGTTIIGGKTRSNRSNQLSLPEGIYVDDDHHMIYITDRYNHRIVEWKFNSSNDQFVTRGNGIRNGIGPLDNPTAIVVDKKNDSIIVCDYDNKRVVRWSRQNDKNGEIIIPKIRCYGLAMDTNGDLYVSDKEKHEVRRWKIGETVGTRVAGGNRAGKRFDQFDFPRHIFVDKDHSLYVSDYNNHRVMKWMEGATNGSVVAGGRGKGDTLTKLNGPMGVTVDHLGNVYVADLNNNRVMRWSNESQEVSVIVGGNKDRNETSMLDGPKGLSFDRQGNLYVVDSRNNRVQKFNIGSNEGVGVFS